MSPNPGAPIAGQLTRYDLSPVEATDAVLAGVAMLELADDPGTRSRFTAMTANEVATRGLLLVADLALHAIAEHTDMVPEAVLDVVADAVRAHEEHTAEDLACLTLMHSVLFDPHWCLRLAVTTLREPRAFRALEDMARTVVSYIATVPGQSVGGFLADLRAACLAVLSGAAA